MKKLLILAYDFPPYVSVGGLRPYNWLLHLKENGVEPIVITRQWQNSFGNHLDYIAPSQSTTTIVEKLDSGEIRRTPYTPNFPNRLMLRYGENKFSILRRGITAFIEFFQFPFPIGTKNDIYKEARNYLTSHKVDAIIATGDPFILFKYASKLSREFNTPWIADYRDPWSDNLPKGSLRRLWERHFEKKYLKNVWKIITVSEFVADKIRQIDATKSIEIIPNGYDEGIIQSLNEIEQQSECLTISFVGTIYPWHPLELFLEQTDLFVQQGGQVKIKFYGINAAPPIEELLAKRYTSLKDRVQITPKIPNTTLLRELARDNVMLLFNYYSFMGTKIFDYLGIRRKMLLCFQNDEDANELKSKYYPIDDSKSTKKELQADLIKETNSGIVVQDKKQLMDVFIELEHEFKQYGKIRCESVGVENYSRTIQTKKLAELILSCGKN